MVAFHQHLLYANVYGVSLASLKNTVLQALMSTFRKALQWTWNFPGTFCQPLWKL